MAKQILLFTGLLIFSTITVATSKVAQISNNVNCTHLSNMEEYSAERRPIRAQNVTASDRLFLGCPTHISIASDSNDKYNEVYTLTGEVDKLCTWQRITPEEKLEIITCQIK